jgi:hypothetical protein
VEEFSQNQLLLNERRCLRLLVLSMHSAARSALALHAASIVTFAVDTSTSIDLTFYLESEVDAF